MSDFPPSYFVDQQFDGNQDDLLDPSIFDEANFDHLFADDETLANPDGLVSDQGPITEITENKSSGHEEPQASLQKEEHLFQVDYDELIAEQEEISRMLKAIAANEPTSHEQPQDSLPDTDRVPQYEVEDQVGVSSLQNTIPEGDSANHSQQQFGLPNDEHQDQFELNTFGESHEGMRSLQRIYPANDSSNFGQSQVRLLNEEFPPGFDLEQFRKDKEELASAGLQTSRPEFQLAFDFSDIRSDPANDTITGGFSNTPVIMADNGQRVQKRLQKAKQTGSSKSKNRRPPVRKQIRPVHHAPNPQGDASTSAATRIPPNVNNGEGSEVNTPGVDSGYGTLNPSPEATNPAYSDQNINTNNEGVKKTKKVRAEADPDFDPANDLNYYPEDPETGVIESRRREGWGRTGLRNGVEVWFNPDTEEWLESASHHSYREILIARAQAEHPNRQYLHPDETDGLPHGETAFFLPHQNLGPDRDDCPDKCFVWPAPEPESEPEDEEAGNKEPAKKKRKHNPRPRPHGPDPGFWFEDNKILLDPHNNPVRKHLDIPLTLSAHTEGYKMDLMRILNASISQRDLWARMPRWIRRRTPKTNVWYTGYIGDPNTHVNMPSRRFRDEKGAIAGQDRDGSKIIREGLKEYFAERGFDPSLTGSTRGFGRDLLPWEQDLVKLKNKGKHLARAGERALDKETREKNNERLQKKIAKGRKNLEADLAKAGGASGKRPHHGQDGDFQDPNPTHQKSESGDHSHKGRGKRASLQPQRYGIHGALQTQYQSTSTLEAAGRSYYGTYGAVQSPYESANAIGGNQQAPSLGNSHLMGSPNVSPYPGIALENNARLNYPQQGSWGQAGTMQAPVPEGQSQPPPSPANYGLHTPQPHLPRGTNNVPVNGLDRFRGEPIQYIPPQTTGKRDRFDSGIEQLEDSLGPGGKRRRMPGTGGYDLPPRTQRRAEKKLLKSKRDEHLPPPVFNIDDNSHDTSQIPRVAATNQVPHGAGTQGPFTPHMPISAPDIRDVPPATEWECQRLQDALEYTRWAYAQWTGMNAPATNRMESYNAQFKVIFDAFHIWWHSMSNPERLQPVEWLVQLDAWEGTVADWKPPVADGLLYECVRRGFYAPRNGDGSLQ